MKSMIVIFSVRSSSFISNIILLKLNIEIWKMNFRWKWHFSWDLWVVSCCDNSFTYAVFFYIHNVDVEMISGRDLLCSINSSYLLPIYKQDFIFYSYRNSKYALFFHRQLFFTPFDTHFSWANIFSCAFYMSFDWLNVKFYAKKFLNNNFLFFQNKILLHIWNYFSNFRYFLQHHFRLLFHFFIFCWFIIFVCSNIK